MEIALLSYLVMSFAGSGIPASKNRAIELIAVYHEICVQVQPMLWKGDVLMDLSGITDLDEQFQMGSKSVRMKFY